MTPPLLLYDGFCGFCDSAVRLILRLDPDGSMEFAPLHGSTARTILDQRPDLSDVDSLILVHRAGSTPEVFIRSDAVIRIGRYLGGVWSPVVALRFVPRGVRDWGYALFARHRYRVFRRLDACPLPPPEARGRFLP